MCNNILFSSLFRLFSLCVCLCVKIKLYLMLMYYIMPSTFYVYCSFIHIYSHPINNSNNQKQTTQMRIREAQIKFEINVLEIIVAVVRTIGCGGNEDNFEIPTQSGLCSSWAYGKENKLISFVCFGFFVCLFALLRVM